MPPLFARETMYSKCREENTFKQKIQTAGQMPAQKQILCSYTNRPDSNYFNRLMIGRESWPWNSSNWDFTVLYWDFTVLSVLSILAYLYDIF